MILKDTIQDDDVEGILEKSFTDWDAQRAEGLNDLLVFGVSRAEADQQNFERLLLKYGEEHPQVIQAAARVEANNLFVGELKREVVRAETPYPAEQPETWTIYGYVFNAENDGIGKAPVVLFDAEEEEIIHGVTTETDARGQFRLRITNLEKLPRTVRAGVPPDFMSEEVFAPEKGETDYAEIIVDDEIGENPACEPKCDPDEDPSTGNPIPTGTNFSDWMVTGKVMDASGKGVPRLKVRVFDKDFIFDDALGETETRADGVYSLIFTKKQFSRFENYPELYLIIEDAAGNVLYNGKRQARGAAGHIELIDVQLYDYGGSTNKLNREE